MDISNLGNIIRWPIELIGKSLTFIFKYFIEILIIAGTLWFVYWIFSSGMIRRISETINEGREKKRLINILQNKR